LKRALAFFLLVLPLWASDPWTDDDKMRQAATVALLAMDWGQTLDLERYQQPPVKRIFTEENPILGTHPSRRSINRYFICSIVSTFFIADFLPAKWRTVFHGVILTIQSGVILKNLSLGLRIRFWIYQRSGTMKLKGDAALLEPLVLALPFLLALLALILLASRFI
jgi:hypothetical protein